MAKKINRLNSNPLVLKKVDPKVKGFLKIPFGEEGFKDFIKSLLGSPQSIQRAFFGSFEIDTNDILQLHETIKQRIDQQNQNSLIEFTARIVYEDNSSQLINSIDEFETFNEIRKVYPTSLHLSWSYLVQFVDKNVPEKQTIQFSLVTSDQHRVLLDHEGPIGIPIHRSFLNYNVRHTARTWGGDMEALLANYAESILLKEGKIKDFIRKHSVKISFSFGLFLFLASLLTTLWSAVIFSQNKLQNTRNYLSDFSDLSQSSMNAKIDFIANSISDGGWAQFYFGATFFLIFMAIVAIVIFIWLESYIENERPSFLLLTKEAKNHKQKVLRDSKKKWRNSIILIIGTLIMNIISNYIFWFLTK